MSSWRTAAAVAVAGIFLCRANQAPKTATAAESGRAPAIHIVHAGIPRGVVVRLRNGMDMMEGLQTAVRQEKIKSAVIVSGFGSLTSYRVHVVGNTTLPPQNIFTRRDGPYDIVSVGGMIIDGTVHCHITVSDTEKAVGGHLELGSTVFTFAVITLGVFDDSTSLSRVDDADWH